MSRMRFGVGITAVAALSVAAAAASVLAPGGAPVAEKQVVVESPGKKQVVVIKESGGRGTGAFLGVTLREETESSEGGARVTSVVPDSPAAKSGLKKGDIIVGFGGDVVRGPVKVTQKIHAAKPGDKVVVGVLRDGRRESLSVELGKSNDSMRVFLGGDETDAEEAYAEAMRGLEEGKLGQEEALRAQEEARQEVERAMEQLRKDMPQIREQVRKQALVAPRARVWMWKSDRPRLGVELVETTSELRQFLGGAPKTGVLVGKVLDGSAAEKAGLRVGDLILSVGGTDVEDAGDVIDAVEENAGTQVDIDVLRDKKALRLKATLPKDEEAVEDEPIGPRAELDATDDPIAPTPWGPADEVPAPPAPPEPPAAPLPPPPPVPPSTVQFV